MSKDKAIQLLQQLVQEGFTDWSSLGDIYGRDYDDLVILNYHEGAIFEDNWEPIEQVSRGLILNRSGEIVARPFDKFWNWFERGQQAHGHMVSVTEKLDGTLGILYRKDGAYHIATRGSFDGPQAEWATNFLHSYYNIKEIGPIADEWTLLFEIIYPENRVVIDYGDREELVLIGMRNRFTGEYGKYFVDLMPLSDKFGFGLPMYWGFNRVEDILEATGKIDGSQEGWVAEFSDGSRWKFKGDRYLELHKLIFGLSFNRVLEAHKQGKTGELLKALPEEFRNEVLGHLHTIEYTIRTKVAETTSAFAAAPKTTRKEFAQFVMQNHSELSSYLFAMLDGRDIVPLILNKEF